MICAPEHVASALQRDLTAPEEAEARSMIAEFQEEMEGHLQRSIEPREFTETRRVGPSDYVDGTLEFFVDRGPVVEVVSAEGEHGPIDAADLTPNHGGILVAGAGAGVLTVTYVGGWSEAKARPARRAIIGRVGRALNRSRDDAVGVVKQTVERDSIQWSDEGWTEAELAAVDHLRKRA